MTSIKYSAPARNSEIKTTAPAKNSEKPIGISGGGRVFFGIFGGAEVHFMDGILSTSAKKSFFFNYTGLMAQGL